MTEAIPMTSRGGGEITAPRLDTGAIIAVRPATKEKIAAKKLGVAVEVIP